MTREYIGYEDPFGGMFSSVVLTDEEIIRCRDCKHLKEHEDSWPRHSKYTCGDAGIVTLDGFCAWGVRRDV